MEDKLEEYRVKLRRKENLDKIKQRLLNMVNFNPENNRKNDEVIEVIDVSKNILIYVHSIHLH